MPVSSPQPDASVGDSSSVIVTLSEHVEDLPLAYLPGNAVRARVRVVGDIARVGEGGDVADPTP